MADTKPKRSNGDGMLYVISSRTKGLLESINNISERLVKIEEKLGIIEPATEGVENE